MKKITFYTAHENLKAIPYPAPAKEFLPDWWKEMPIKANDNKPTIINNVTMRACPGIRDAINLGYILPAWCDFFIDTRSMHFESSTGENFLDIFPTSIAKNFPFPTDHEPIFLKFRSPWKVSSSKNMTLLIESPKFRFNLPYQIYDGSTDIGNHLTDINVMMSVKRDSIIEFKRGDPLLQLIPFETDNTKAEVKEMDTEKVKQWRQELRTMKSYAIGGFFKNFYQKKTFE